MKEYEQLLLQSDGLNKTDSSNEDDKLSTIDETASLEGQVKTRLEMKANLKKELAAGINNRNISRQSVYWSVQFISNYPALWH
jgi:hypothetical protein